jgi:PRC-barrel domain
VVEVPLEPEMHTEKLSKKPIRTLIVAALSSFAAVTLAVAADDAPGPAPGESTDHASTGTAEPPSVTVLNTHEVEGILGRQVLGAADENMGRIVDVIVDRSGRVRAAVIDFGGFLGVGSRKIAVDWSALHFPPPGQSNAKISLDLTRDQVKAAPEYQEGKPIVVLGALGKLEPLPFE